MSLKINISVQRDFPKLSVEEVVTVVFLSDSNLSFYMNRLSTQMIRVAQSCCTCTICGNGS